MTWAEQTAPYSSVTPESAGHGLGLASEESGWRTRRIAAMAFPIVSINDTLDMLTRRQVDESVNYPPWTKTRFYAREDIGQEEQARIQELCLARDKHYARLAEMLLEEE